MLTDRQRTAFFRLARAAHARVSPGIPFDAWRKDEMRSAGLPDSVALVDHVEGIYRQAGMKPREFADAPAPRLWEMVQILDTHIRRLADRNVIPRHALPTAGEPWHFRGKRAAFLAAVLAHRSPCKPVADQSQHAPLRPMTVAI